MAKCIKMIPTVILVLSLVLHHIVASYITTEMPKCLYFYTKNYTTPTTGLQMCHPFEDTTNDLTETLFLNAFERFLTLQPDFVEDQLSLEDQTEFEHLSRMVENLARMTNPDLGSKTKECAHPMSCTLFAILLDTGHYKTDSTEQDVVLWTKLAAEQGQRDAQENFAFLIEQGRVFFKNEKQAIKEAGKWRMRSAKQGLAEAQWMLGLTFRGGRGLKADPTKAKHWLLQAALQGHLYAQYDYAMLLEGSDDAEVEAFTLMLSAASHNHSLAMHNLAIRYHQGQGVEADESLALFWFEKAAGAGLALSALTLGMLHETEEITTASVPSAVRWYNTAGKLGEGAGYASVGAMLEEGVIGEESWEEKDAIKEACVWYRKGADIGDAGSIHEVGKCVSLGLEGTAPNEVEGSVWFELARSRGYRQEHDGVDYSIFK